MSITTDALSAPCRKCGAATGEPCVYLWPPGLSRDGSSPTSRAALEREGTPTARPHNERLTDARDRADRQLRRERTAIRNRRPVLEPLPRQRRELLAAAESINAAARDEHRQLRAWLSDWGWLLTGEGT